MLRFLLAYGECEARKTCVDQFEVMKINQLIVKDTHEYFVVNGALEMLSVMLVENVVPCKRYSNFEELSSVDASEICITSKKAAMDEEMAPLISKGLIPLILKCEIPENTKAINTM